MNMRQEMRRYKWLIEGGITPGIGFVTVIVIIVIALIIVIIAIANTKTLQRG
jgi:hypothetical protein